MKGIIGRKCGMTQVYAENGKVVPVTVIEAGPCAVVQVKTRKRDGYAAIQLGFDEIKAARTNKPMQGHFAGPKVTPRRRLHEFRFDEAEGFEAGGEVRADIFEIGDMVDVQGVSKGRGFQGGVKRHGFSGQPASHGSKQHREMGSIGQCATPGRVWKGHRMPGHMGARTTTTRNLEVVQVDAERNLLVVKGAIPGANKEFVYVSKRN